MGEVSNMQKKENLIEISVDLDLETAKKLEYIARYEGCTVEELIRHCLEKRLAHPGSLRNPPAPARGQ